jgi:uncharacterized protein
VTRIVVTGASRGIGAALAVELARRGNDLVLVARSADDLDRVAAEASTAECFVADLADVEGIGGLVTAIEAAGPIDVVVNNAGVDLTGRFWELPPERIAHLVRLNLVAPLLLARAVIPGMLTRGSGHIVNVSSLSGTNTIPGLVPYSASKAGLSHATGVLRADLRGTPITTTLVEIGPVAGEMMGNLRAYGPTRRSVQRLARLRLTYDLDIDKVAIAIADAIDRRSRHLRLPRRDVLFPLLTEAPRRLTEWLLAGVDHRQD